MIQVTGIHLQRHPYRSARLSHIRCQATEGYRHLPNLASKLLAMDRYSVDSSTISGLGYDSQTRRLEVYFFQGGSYRYFDVPEFVLRAFLKAASKGQYFNRCIADRYKFEEIK
jgi:hypothetical protein